MGFCGFDPSEYQPVPVNVKVNVDVLAGVLVDRQVQK